MEASWETVQEISWSEIVCEAAEENTGRRVKPLSGLWLSEDKYLREEREGSRTREVVALERIKNPTLIVRERKRVLCRKG